MRPCYFYCLRELRFRRIAFDPGLTPHCVLSRIWFYETLNLRLRRGVGAVLSRLSSLRCDRHFCHQQFMAEARSAKILRVKLQRSEQSIDDEIRQYECRYETYFTLRLLLM